MIRKPLEGHPTRIDLGPLCHEWDCLAPARGSMSRSPRWLAFCPGPSPIGMFISRAVKADTISISVLTLLEQLTLSAVSGALVVGAPFGLFWLFRRARLASPGRTASVCSWVSAGAPGLGSALPFLEP